MRVRRIHVTHELLADLFTTGSIVTKAAAVSDGLPEGAILVGIVYDAQARSWAFDFYHPDFDELFPGCVPMALAPMFRVERPMLAK